MKSIPTTFEELRAAIQAVLPSAYFGEDNEGQIIIYTDLKEDDDGELGIFVPAE